MRMNVEHTKNNETSTPNVIWVYAHTEQPNALIERSRSRHTHTHTYDIAFWHSTIISWATKNYNLFTRFSCAKWMRGWASCLLPLLLIPKSDDPFDARLMRHCYCRLSLFARPIVARAGLTSNSTNKSVAPDFCSANACAVNFYSLFAHLRFHELHLCLLWVCVFIVLCSIVFDQTKMV